jgi:aspartate/methionine/tyrosine aminotransferase
MSSKGDAIVALNAGLLAYVVWRLVQIRKARSSTVASSDTQQGVAADAQLVSSRGRAASAPALPYLGAMGEAFANWYDADTNPTGLILLAVAENKLSFTELLTPAFVAAAAPDTAYNYGPGRGSAALREEIAKLFSNRICPGVHVTPDDLAVNAGVAAALSNTLMALLERGDGVLVPAPYYSAFDNDLKSIAQVEPIEVRCTSPDYAITEQALADACDRATAQGHPPTAVLLTNPHNPLGICYSKEQLQMIIAFCIVRRMHLISDEIYALSTFHGLSTVNRAAGVSEVPFTSVASLMDNGKLSDYVHLLWGFSKDFGASGLRVGVLFTHNRQLITAMDNYSIFSSASGHTQAALAAVLSDESVISNYLTENSVRLAKSYDIVAEWLDRVQLPYTPATSGIFIWIDLRSLLTEHTWYGESLLFDKMKNICGVILTPGSAQHSDIPGFFRLCYAYHTATTLQTALSRLEKLL